MYIYTCIRIYIHIYVYIFIFTYVYINIYLGFRKIHVYSKIFLNNWGLGIKMQWYKSAPASTCKYLRLVCIIF